MKRTQCEIEEWKPIAGYEGLYEVSNMGKVRSYQNFGNGLRKEPKVIKPSVNSYGYLCITLCKNRTHKNKSIHRIVAETFIKTDDMGLQIDHVNGIKTDNRVSNLEWVTPKENTLRSVMLGLKPRGEKHGNSKLKQKEVETIRELYKAGKHTQRQLGAIFGVCHSVIGDIVRNETWVS